MSKVSRRTLLALAGSSATGVALSALGSSSVGATPPIRVRASEFGFDPVDSTAAIRAALDSTADIVIVDNVGSDWITGPLHIRRDDVSVIVEPGVTVRAKVGAFPGKYDSLWLVDGHSNVRILGYGATFAMNKAEYTGEWRCALRVHSSQNITVEGLVLRDAPGDGLYIGKTLSGRPLPNYCTNITVRNVVCDNNKRNGMSVISVDGLLVEGCAFNNTSGTAPEAGVDFEPNSPDQRLSNIVVRDSVATGNAKIGWNFNFGSATAAGTPTSLHYERISSGPTAAAVFGVRGSNNFDAGGVVTVTDSLLNSTAAVGATYLSTTGAYQGIRTSFSNVTWWGTENPSRPDGLIKITSGARFVPHQYGNVQFDDAQVYTDQVSPFLSVEEGAGTNGLANVHGQFDVVSPNEVSTSLGVNPTDVELEIEALSTPPATEVSAHVSRPWVRMGETTYVRIRSHSDDLSRSLAVAYHCVGSAQERFHYDGLATVAVIRAGEETVEVPIRTRSLRRGAQTPTISFVIDPGPSYSIGPSHRASIALLPQ